MNYEHLTDDELIVAVAEAKGWRLCSIGPRDGIVYPPTNWFLKLPHDSPTIIMRKENRSWKDFMEFLPDYRQPAEYMALMGEIWKTKPGSILAINGVAWNLRDGNYCDGVFGDYPRWRAICIAWLEIVGGKE